MAGPSASRRKAAVEVPAPDQLHPLQNVWTTARPRPKAKAAPAPAPTTAAPREPERASAISARLVAGFVEFKVTKNSPVTYAELVAACAAQLPTVQLGGLRRGASVAIDPVWRAKRLAHTFKTWACAGQCMYAIPTRAAEECLEPDLDVPPYRAPSTAAASHPTAIPECAA